jgi:hypothetical protein
MGEPTEILKQDDTDTGDIQNLDGTAENGTQNDGSETDADGTVDENDTDETGETGDETDEKPEEPDLKEALSNMEKDNTQLRQMLRQQNRDFRAFKEQVEAGVTPEVDPEDDEFADLDESEVKKPTVDVDAIAASARETQLDTYIETMRMSDKYGDVDDVLSIVHFDDTIEMLADKWMESNPDSPMPKSEVVVEVERSIWAQKNPFRYMYDVVKKTHPTYSKDTKVTTKKLLNKDEVVPSVTNLAAAKKTTNAGWTSAKIDALPENELHTVPTEVYDKYLKEELN